MSASYRFGARPSYARGASLPAFALALALAAMLTDCSDERPPLPERTIVAARIPAAWPRAPRADAVAGPRIAALRFSTLDVALGRDWNGDAVASLDTTRIDVRTNLFDFAMPQTAPGHFHFAMHVLDLPSFLVRSYALHIVASTRDGRTTTLLVPLRIHGRV